MKPLLPIQFMLRFLRMGSALFGIVLASGTVIPLHAQSLYNEQTYRPLAGDNKAFRVGDLITIQIYENSSAVSTTDTNTQRNNGLGVAIAVPQNSRPWGGTASVGGTFEGGGTTQRTNKLLAVISVSVREILPNGDLKIAGEQLLTVNEEQHKVHVEGRVRPQDISADNTVLSTRLADARINYIGDGDLSKRQKRPWWRRFVDWLGL